MKNKAVSISASSPTTVFFLQSLFQRIVNAFKALFSDPNDRFPQKPMEEPPKVTKVKLKVVSGVPVDIPLNDKEPKVIHTVILFETDGAPSANNFYIQDILLSTNTGVPILPPFGPTGRTGHSGNLPTFIGKYALYIVSGIVPNPNLMDGTEINVSASNNPVLGPAKFYYT